MFWRASKFNQDLSSWDVSEVTDMTGMFRTASKFNQSLANWDTSEVTNMKNMFQGASEFNQDLSSWDVSEVTDMTGMFKSASAFNQNLSGWDVSQVTDMSSMFESAVKFNQNLSNWQVCQVSSYTDFDKDASVWVDENKPKLGGTCVISVSSSNADGTYGQGEEINIIIHFNRNVSVEGMPQLELEFDNGSKFANYLSGSNSEKPNF